MKPLGGVWIFIILLYLVVSITLEILENMWLKKWIGQRSLGRNQTLYKNAIYVVLLFRLVRVYTFMRRLIISFKSTTRSNYSFSFFIYLFFFFISNTNTKAYSIHYIPFHFLIYNICKLKQLLIVETSILYTVCHVESTCNKNIARPNAFVYYRSSNVVLQHQSSCEDRQSILKDRWEIDRIVP